MTISLGMLLFGIIDATVAFFLVFFVSRSKFGGPKKTMARPMGAILGTLVGAVYLALIIWFNTEKYTLPEIMKGTIYAAPFVLSILMIVLTLLSAPPKKEEEEKEENPEGENEEEQTTEQTQ